MRHPEDGFGVAVAVGGMDVAFDDVIAHEAIDYERAFPIGGADHKGMPEDVALIDECVGADALSLAEILERTAGSEAFAAHLELLSIAGGMQLVRLVPIDIGQVHLIHSFDHSVIRGADIVERKSPIKGSDAGEC